MRVHLVYPHRRVATTPDAIGWRVADALSARWETLVYDWSGTVKIRPEVGDVLIGHPHPAPFTTVRRSWDQRGWARRIVLAPFSGTVHTNAFEDRIIRSADLFLAITGVPWFESMPFGAFSSWSARTRQVDLGVDQEAYPMIKDGFSAPGRRKFLYLGNKAFYKNPTYLEALARALPEVEMGWIGAGGQLEGFVQHGAISSATEEARRIIAQYDFLVMVGSNDANPTSVLEAMAWGLLPMTTPTAGYDARDGVIELPAIDHLGAAEILRKWNAADEDALRVIQNDNLKRIRDRFTWNRLVSQVVEAVEGEESVPAVTLSRRERALMVAGELSSPFVYSGAMLRAPIGCLLGRSSPGEIWSP